MRPRIAAISKRQGQGQRLKLSPIFRLGKTFPVTRRLTCDRIRFENPVKSLRRNA